MASSADLLAGAARRLLETPPDQHLLFLDRLNDLSVSLGEYEPIDARLLAAAMNEFEQRANLSVIVETNLGTHRPDCMHVGYVADAYARLSGG